MGAVYDLFLQSVQNKGKKRHLTGAFDSGRQFTLMLRAGAGRTARKNLRSLGNIFLQARDILIVDDLDIFLAECADFLSPMHRMKGARCVISFHECITFLTHRLL